MSSCLLITMSVASSTFLYAEQRMDGNTTVNLSCPESSHHAHLWYLSWGPWTAAGLDLRMNDCALGKVYPRFQKMTQVSSKSVYASSLSCASSPALVTLILTTGEVSVITHRAPFYVSGPCVYHLVWLVNLYPSSFLLLIGFLLYIWVLFLVICNANI